MRKICGGTNTGCLPPSYPFKSPEIAPAVASPPHASRCYKYKHVLKIQVGRFSKIHPYWWGRASLYSIENLNRDGIFIRLSRVTSAISFNNVSEGRTWRLLQVLPPVTKIISVSHKRQKYQQGAGKLWWSLLCLTSEKLGHKGSCLGHSPEATNKCSWGNK